MHFFIIACRPIEFTIVMLALWASLSIPVFTIYFTESSQSLTQFSSQPCLEKVLWDFLHWMTAWCLFPSELYSRFDGDCCDPSALDSVTSLCVASSILSKDLGSWSLEPFWHVSLPFGSAEFDWLVQEICVICHDCICSACWRYSCAPEGYIYWCAATSIYKREKKKNVNL